MLSRVANSIYWMSRYIERAENVARFIQVNHHLMLDLPLNGQGQWLPLVITTGDKDVFKARYDEPSAENVIRFLTFDPDNPNSILSSVITARENARTVRDAISSEMWEQMNQMYLMVRSASANPPDSLHVFLRKLKMASHLFVGLMETTMAHNEAWHFARLGRLCECADKTARILDVKYFIILPQTDYIGTPYDVMLWSALLKSASAFEMYRKRYQQVTPEDVASFLMFDQDFPRSMYACLVRAERSLHAITTTPMDRFANSAERQLGQLRSDLGYAQIDEIIEAGLHEYLDGFQVRLNKVGNAIADTFFVTPALADATMETGQPSPNPA